MWNVELQFGETALNEILLSVMAILRYFYKRRYEMAGKINVKIMENWHDGKSLFVIEIL
jgi:hypothetical protein